MLDVYVKTQAELDAMLLDTRDYIYVNIDFGTKENPAIVKKQHRYPVRTINNSVVAIYNSSKVWAYNNSIVYAHDNCQVRACDNSIVYAYDNSEVSADDNSNICAYDNSKVRAWNDKCIVSINDNAIMSSPSILCSGAELLNQCNGNIDDVNFTISNVPDDDKDFVFSSFYDTNGRVFIFTMRGISNYCVYNFDTMSLEFYTKEFCCAFEDIADDTVLVYYLDNVLLPALVNTRFDKNVKSNII